MNMFLQQNQQYFEPFDYVGWVKFVPKSALQDKEKDQINTLLQQNIDAAKSLNMCYKTHEKINNFEQLTTNDPSIGYNSFAMIHYKPNMFKRSNQRFMSEIRLMEPKLLAFVMFFQPYVNGEMSPKLSGVKCGFDFTVPNGKILLDGRIQSTVDTCIEHCFNIAQQYLPYVIISYLHERNEDDLKFYESIGFQKKSQQGVKIYMHREAQNQQLLPSLQNFITSSQ